ncbi:sigma-70 family RNA polymerase sigma factor [Glycomyces halotolerans]
MHTQLFEDNAADLHRFLSRRLNDPRDADDLLQEVFLRAVRKPPAGDGRAWLFAVARNVLTDHYRRPRRESPSAEIPETPAEGPERRNPVTARAARCAAGLLESLPGDQAEALRRVDMGASTQRLAAQDLGISVSGMKSRVQRGRAALRRLLQACCPTRTDARGGVLSMQPCERVCDC